MEYAFEDWETPGWRRRVTRWIDAALSENDLQRTGPFEAVHMRPWSLVLPATTTGGRVYFKATSSGLRYEAALVQLLSEMFPCNLPELLAVDQGQGWFLSKDGGEKLRFALQAGTPALWEDVLDDYAKIQLVMIDRVDQLLALGMPDRRPQALPELFHQVLEEPQMLCVGHPEGLTASELHALDAFAPRLQVLCDRLAAFHLPASLDHGDMHDGNIFVGGKRPRFVDWGDAAVAHPFFSLQINIVNPENPYVLEQGSPWFERLRDRYLERWAVYGSPASLQAAFRLSRLISPFISVLRWRQALSALPADEPNPYPWGIASLLRELLRLNS